MKTIPFLTASVLAAAFLATGAIAQTSEETAPAAAASPVAPIPAPDQVIYIPRLPSPAEVTSAAVAQGLKIEQIAQMAGQVTVVYRRADGQISTVAYQLLPAAGTPTTGPAPTAVVQSPATATMVAAPATTVVYASTAPAYYYDPFYDPWPWFGGVVFDVGFGHGFRRFDGRRGFFRGGDGHFRGGDGHFRGGDGHRGGGFRDGRGHR